MRTAAQLSPRPAAAALLGGSAVAWLGLVAYEPPMGALGFLFGWTLMMAAMMLPSILPLAALHRGSDAGLAAGYLAAWSATGLLPWVAMEHDLSPALALVLAAAGAYELSPLKNACLRRCRNPVGFLIEHARSGPFRLGVEHGVWCIGCCAGLMAVLVLAASMSLLWAALLAGVVFAQKVLPLGETTTRVTGAALIIAAVATAFA
jgi:predicted metal-binding membrane protein